MKRAQPKEGFEYTFRFHKDGKTSFTTLTYEGVSENGRLVFYNKASKAFTSMRPDRFSYIHRFNLVKEKAIETAPVQARIKEVDSRLIEENPIVEPSKEKYEQYNRFKDVAAQTREEIETAIKMPYVTFLRLLKQWEAIPIGDEEIAFGKKTGITIAWLIASRILAKQTA